MVGSMQVRRSVLVPLRGATSFADIFHPTLGPLGGILLPLSAGLSVGETVDLEVTFAAENQTFHARGIVRWRRLAAQPSLPAGIGVELAENERNTRDLLLRFSRGVTDGIVHRNHRRFPVALDVSFRSGSFTISDVTDNLSRGGCFIRTENALPVGQKVRLKLRPPGFRFAIDLQGVVRWHGNGDRPGFGVEFQDVSRSATRKLDELLVRIKDEVAHQDGATG